jgi:hypothetical protein
MSEEYDLLFRRAQLAYTRGKEQRERDTEVLHPYTGGLIQDPWYYYDRMFRGFQYDFANKMASWASMPVVNKIFAGVESYTTMLCDNNPSIYVVPREPSDEEQVEVARAAVQYWWDSNHMGNVTSLAVKTSRIFGIGWFHTYYDEDRKEVKCKTVHPAHIIVDPDCTVENFDPAYLIYEYKAQYGDVKDMYEGNELEYGYTVDFSNFNKSKTWHIEVPSSGEGDRYANPINPATTVNVYQFWFKDQSRVIWDEEDPELGKKVKKSKKKYPKGRVVTIAGGMVVDDKANPYDHGEFPFVPLHCYAVPGRFYSIGDVQMVLNIQAMRNRLIQLINDGLMKAGGGYLWVGENSGVNVKKIGNGPLNIIPCRDPQQVRFDRPLPPPRHVFDFIATMDKDFDDTMGIHEISRGGQMSSHITAQQINVMAESDRTRVRQAARNLIWSLKKVTAQSMYNLAQFHDKKWYLRIAGNLNEVTPDGTEDGASPNFREREFTGKDLMNIDGDNIKYDFIFDDSSMLPTTQNERTTNVERWVGMGLVTPDEVMKYKLIDIPEADKILADRLANPVPDPNAAQADPNAMPIDPMAMMGGGMPMMGGGMPMQQQMPPQQMPMPQQQMPQQLPPELMALLSGGGGVDPNSAMGADPNAMMGPEAMQMPQGGPDMGLVEGLAGPQFGAEQEEFMAIVERLAQTYGVPAEQILQMLTGKDPGMGAGINPQEMIDSAI